MTNQHYGNNNPSANRGRGSSGGDGGGASRVLMVALVVLALIASVLMLLLDSAMWQRIAVVAALWSAVLGIVLVSKYANALRAEKQRTRMLERTYEAELDAEASHYQQREAAIAQDYDKRLRDHRDEQLDQLRAELVSLRAQLAELSGQEFGPEQTSVRARAERVIELDGRRGASQSRAYSQPQAHQSQQRQQPQARSQAQPQSAPAQKPSPEPERKVPGFSTGSFAAVKWSGDSADETTQIPVIVDTTGMTSTNNKSASASADSPSASPASTWGHEQQSQQSPQSPQDYRGHHENPASFGDDFQEAPAQPAPAQAEEAQPEGAHEDHARGRRRADERSGGLTVAELMKRFESRDKN